MAFFSAQYYPEFVVTKLGENTIMRTENDILERMNITRVSSNPKPVYKGTLSLYLH